MPPPPDDTPRFTSGMVAKAVGVKRQTVTDLLRRYGRTEDQGDGWKKFTLAEALAATASLQLIRLGFRPQLAQRISWGVQDILEGEAVHIVRAERDGADWRDEYRSAPAYLAIELVDPSAPTMDFSASRIDARSAQAALPSGAAPVVVLPLSALAIALGDALLADEAGE